MLYGKLKITVKHKSKKKKNVTEKVAVGKTQKLQLFLEGSFEKMSKN